jgi:hypothetical protein
MVYGANIRVPVAQCGRIARRILAMLRSKSRLARTVSLTHQQAETHNVSEQQMSQSKIGERILILISASTIAASISGDALASPYGPAAGIPDNSGMSLLGDDQVFSKGTLKGDRSDGGAIAGDATRKAVHQLRGLELERFIAGKAMFFGSRSTGDRYEISYAAGGYCVVRLATGERREAEAIRETLDTDPPGVPSTYSITPDGKLTTQLDGRSFTVKIYKNGSTYLAIESNNPELPLQW